MPSLPLQANAPPRLSEESVTCRQVSPNPVCNAAPKPRRGPSPAAGRRRSRTPGAQRPAPRPSTASVGAPAVRDKPARCSPQRNRGGTPGRRQSPGRGASPRAGVRAAVRGNASPPRGQQPAAQQVAPGTDTGKEVTAAVGDVCALLRRAEVLWTKLHGASSQPDCNPRSDASLRPAPTRQCVDIGCQTDTAPGPATCDADCQTTETASASSCPTAALRAAVLGFSAPTSQGCVFSADDALCSHGTVALSEQPQGGTEAESAPCVASSLSDRGAALSQLERCTVRGGEAAAAAWLHGAGYAEYIDLFAQHGWTLTHLPHLRESDLIAMGIDRVGTRRGILVEVEHLWRRGVGDSQAAAPWRAGTDSDPPASTPLWVRQDREPSGQRRSPPQTRESASSGSCSGAATRVIHGGGPRILMSSGASSGAASFGLIG
eukprot:TRINITY_DN5636_c0_g1_i2.p1 TRINITY_DN5636_c0_g1~~TRINITY_DN5636_c0_g1_i2.p1  ORF type:complete len:477 (+),score=11.26 TRINITY_DN5636_c0_g1_i2:133-1431(+)